MFFLRKEGKMELYVVGSRNDQECDFRCVVIPILLDVVCSVFCIAFLAPAKKLSV